MLTGLEFIQKNYSSIEEEERLYSTGNEELDELLEKAFCDGYEYAQAEFSKDEEDEEDEKLTKEDEDIIKYNSKWIYDRSTKKSREKWHDLEKRELRNHKLSEDEKEQTKKDRKKLNKKLIAKAAAEAGIAGATIGAIDHFTDPTTKIRREIVNITKDADNNMFIPGLAQAVTKSTRKDLIKDGIKRIGGDALIGAAVGGGLTYGAAKLGNKLRSKHDEAKKADSSKRKEDERAADLLDVADGKMSRAEFKKKWYK